MIEELTTAELVALAAEDSEFFCRAFFPDTFRQTFPAYATDVWHLMEDPSHRNVALKMFRGSSKTTILRAFAAKRIAYALSRTILFTSASQSSAIKSTTWIQRQIERQTLFATTFGLKRGAKWTEEWFEVVNEVAGCTINVVAAGMTGQIRGLNIDDYRPDLIVSDDPLDEENTGTKEQCVKIADRLFGAVQKSLAPRSEAPHAKMVLLQTPFVDGDAIDVCCKDKSWASREYGCFDENNESRWAARFPTQELLDDKRSHMQRNQMSLWMREMEVKIISGETSTFLPTWLQYWGSIDTEAPMITFMGIDPAPPPRNELAARSHTRDFEALAVVGLYKKRFFLLEIASNRGHQPDWTVREFLRLCNRWRPVKCVVEAVNYQATLKWILDQALLEQRLPWYVEAVNEKRKKPTRIAQALVGISSRHQFFVHREMTKFIEQYKLHPATQYDDELDATARAVEAAISYGSLDYDDLLPEVLGYGTTIEDVNRNFRAAP